MADQDNANQAFADVFARESRDSGADTAAPSTSEQPRDDHGRFAPKEAEQTPAPEAKADTPAPEAAQVEPPPEEPERQHRVPLKEVLTEREKRRAAEEARLQAEARAEAMERQLHMLMQQARAPEPAQQPTQQQDDIPDAILDPKGYANYVRESVRRDFAIQNANVSELRARQKYGPELVEAAKRAVLANNAGEHFLYRADPYEEAVSWYRRASFLQRVGPDPDAYEKQREAELRQRILEEMKTKPANVSLPGSLAEATATGPQGGHVDLKSMASSVFARETRRR